MTVHVRWCAKSIVRKVCTSAIQCRNLTLQLLKDTLNDAHRIELVAMDCCRQRQLLACLKTLWCASCNHDGNVHWVAAIELSNTQIISGYFLGRHVREVQVMNDWDTVENIASEVCGRNAAGEDCSSRGDKSEKLHVCV